MWAFFSSTSGPAMNILRNLLRDLSLDEFLEKSFTKLPYSCATAAAGMVHLLDWKVVEEIIKEKKSVLRVVQDGKVIKDYVDLTFEEARDHHRKGHTLLLRFAELSSAPLRALAKDFSESFYSKVDIQLYCSPEGHNAFGWHYDVEEVFIIQTQGSKSYTIRPNTVHPNPLVSSIPKDLEYEKEKTPMEIKVTLVAGDWLYIPSGWWHVARTQQESMHISIGIMPSSAVDLASYLPHFLSRAPFWRARLPIHKKFDSEQEEIAYYQQAMETLGRDLAKNISAPEFIKEFLQWKRSTASLE
ncbi:MAG TPA: cupin domain-containing protein [Bacteriovoracaceae bacterium]|nr:cupin domain-containing protein [Bacteriovoracaceae bacterium]